MNVREPGFNQGKLFSYYFFFVFKLCVVLDKNCVVLNNCMSFFLFNETQSFKLKLSIHENFNGKVNTLTES